MLRMTLFIDGWEPEGISQNKDNMKIICWSLIAVAICFSCGKRSKVQYAEVDEQVSKVATVKEKLDSNLVQGVLKLVASKEHLKYPEMPLSESFIAIFLVQD